MRLNRLGAIGLGLAALVGGRSPAAAQLRANRPPPQQANLPRLLVANPHSFAPQDSTASVRVGHGMREYMPEVADRWYRTVTRAQMNEALLQYAYPVDAVLPPMVARQLAAALTARALVVSTLVRVEAGRFSVEARLYGISDDAGQVARLTQNPNESLEDFGKRIGVLLGPAFRALADARSCEAQRLGAPDKAAAAAARAIRALPNSGLAHYCLAQISLAKKSPGDTVLAHLKLATEGDPMSLNAWTLLAVEYQARHDSTATVATFKQMLRIAPTNEPLRKAAFRLFLDYGQTGAAEQVADEGLQLDPSNADLWDLKSSACLFQDTPEKTRCAVEALERVYEIDSTKADTVFFTKITFAASRPSLVVKARVDSAGNVVIPASAGLGVRDTMLAVVDSTRFLHWARKAIDKYPGNIVLIGQLAEAYGLSGPVDSAVAVTRRLMAVDSSDVGPVLRVIQKLATALRGRDAMELAPYIERLGGPEDRQNLAAILIRPAFQLLQASDYPQVVEMGRKIIKLSEAGSQGATYGNYLLGVALFQQMNELDAEAIKNKTFSCELGQQLKSMLIESEPPLTAGRSVMESFVGPRLQAIPQFHKHVDQIIKQYCK